MTQFDVLVVNGTVATANETFRADIGIRDGRIVALGEQLGTAAQTIDADGKLVLPGGVDTHCHVEQVSGAGLMNADTFESASRSALFGGTTTFVSFAAQHPGKNLRQVVADYQALADRGAICDYAFHMIVSDVTGTTLSEDLPSLIEDGHRSVKLFTVYDKVRVGDETILDVMWCARDHGALVCVHAENDGLIRWMTRRLTAAGKTAPRFHPASHPRIAEIEALSRLCLFSEFTGQPVMLFHISTAEGIDVIAAARARGVRVWAETCPHYLFMQAGMLDRDGREPAGLMCSPPQREVADQEALWAGLAQGVLQVVSSDHAPYRLDASGKFAHGEDAPFFKIANGMPGLETRLPLMFDAMVNKNRLGLQRFVDVTSTAPAKLYGLTGKGQIAPGFDADIVIWDQHKEIRMGALHDNCGYNPYEGRIVRGSPDVVIRRGQIAVSNGDFMLKAGTGRRVPMARSSAMASTLQAPACLDATH